MYVCMLRVRLGLVLGRHPKISLFGLHYCVICCEVETKFSELLNDTKKFVVKFSDFYLSVVFSVYIFRSVYFLFLSLIVLARLD